MHGLGRTACIRCRKKAKNTSDAGYYIAMGNAASTVDEQFLCGVQLWKLKQYSDAIKRVCEKISVSLIFYDKFLGWRMPQSFSGNHPALAAL